MHAYDELAEHGMEFSLTALNQAYERAAAALQTSSATRLVKALQMVQLQKAVLAVGMFSMFEAMLQDELDCADGFREAAVRLDAVGQTTLRDSFSDLQLAINVLKHGRGRSYDALVGKADALPFRVKLPDEHFFFEGDVSEVSTLIEVDDAFVRRCAAIIREVTVALG
jgi:hypothetical protein